MLVGALGLIALTMLTLGVVMVIVSLPILYFFEKGEWLLYGGATLIAVPTAAFVLVVLFAMLAQAWTWVLS